MAGLLVIGALVLTAVASSPSRAVVAPTAAPPASEGAGPLPSYREDVAPLLRRACVQCHGSQQADKGLRLDSYQRMMAGDAVGTVVIPGDSSLSAIVSVVRYGTMPHDGTKLTAAEIATISRWIDAGAPEN